jgi:hypothetical protein
MGWMLDLETPTVGPVGCQAPGFVTEVVPVESEPAPTDPVEGP